MTIYGYEYHHIRSGPEAPSLLLLAPSLIFLIHVLPYCYYYLRVLYFANFCDLEKIAKLSTRKIFYQHIRHVI